MLNVEDFEIVFDGNYLIFIISFLILKFFILN